MEADGGVGRGPGGPPHLGSFRNFSKSHDVIVGRAFMPAACFQQACSAIRSRPEGGCRLIARPTFRHWSFHTDSSAWGYFYASTNPKLAHGAEEGRAAMSHGDQ